MQAPMERIQCQRHILNLLDIQTLKPFQAQDVLNVQNLFAQKITSTKH